MPPFRIADNCRYNIKYAEVTRLIEITHETGIKIIKISDLIEYLKKNPVKRKKK
ncbi:MAG: hypothetical protein PVI26_13310 [Chitinispirillia bacterium]|jgi:hypothetical protein